MPFIGKTPETGAFRLIDSITTSATDTYALQVEGLSYFPSSARNLIVSLNGVTQAPESAYTVSGSNIVFASALTASDVIDYILVIGESVDIGTPSDNTVGNAQLKSDLDFSGKTLTFSADQISGDAINGGTISSFASTGIDDNATSTKLTVSDTGIDVTGTVVADVLTIQGSAQNIAQIETSGTTGSYITFRDADTTAGQRAWLGADADLFKLYSNNSTLNITMKSDGSNNGLTGINNANPSAALDVAGTIRLNGNYPTGTANVALGDDALSSGSLSGGFNVAVGSDALQSNTTANNNVAVGYQASYSNTTGAQNVAVGRQSLYFNTTGANNTAIGDGSLFANTTASNNTAVGRDALLSNTTGTENTVVGAFALDAGTTASYSTAIGIYALGSVTTGSSNVAIGRNAHGGLTTANNNTAVGNDSGYSLTTGSVNTNIGQESGYSLTTGSHNSSLGYQSLRFMSTGSYNTFIGNYAGRSATGDSNTAVGYAAMYLGGSGVANTAIGQSTLYKMTTAGYNTAVGHSAGQEVTTGQYNVAVGAYAMDALTTATETTAIGYNALTAVTTGSSNTAVGRNTGSALTTGVTNVFLGESAGASLTTGSSNTMAGKNCGLFQTTADGSTFYGHSAGRQVTTGAGNTFIGKSAGYYVTTGAGNTVLGQYTGNDNALDMRTLSNNVVLSDGSSNIHFRSHFGLDSTSSSYTHAKFTRNIGFGSGSLTKPQAWISHAHDNDNNTAFRWAVYYDNSGWYTAHILITASALDYVATDRCCAWWLFETAFYNNSFLSISTKDYGGDASSFSISFSNQGASSNSSALIFDASISSISGNNSIVATAQMSAFNGIYEAWRMSS